MSADRLDELRARLSEVDRELIALAARRQRLAEEIGRDKVESGRPTRDFARERAVLEAARAHALAEGVEPRLAEELIRTLIRSSLARQERDRVAAEARGDGRTALVIGGAGRMGRWVADFLESQGFTVHVADRAAAPGEGRFADWRAAGLDYDVVVVAAPLAASAAILHELAGARPRGLVFDIGSLKTPLRSGLEALRDAGCRVTSLHPMFGPDTELLSGRHVILVDVGVSEATAEARALFDGTMAERLQMSVDDHDRFIAYVLGLSHALNVAFFTALAGSGEAAPTLARLSSTTFDAQLALAGAVARENPHLYFEIQHLNAYGLSPLDALVDAVGRIRDLVAEGDEAGFVALMDAGRRYLAARAG
ncbi:MAG: prephenate dehydrogenase/arogenate dehydrogenase family protein [Longimicrobiales bacterium]|nr:prephenate dehydrogenase/arogenate dehydrogenase family protein [Longimicrobiales bacterium]